MSEDLTPLAGAVSTLRLLKDGSISVTVEFEPKDRVAVMQMMGTPGQPIACVPLKQGFAAVPARPADERGPLCKSAIKLCQEPLFQKFAARGKAWPADEGGAKGYLLLSCGHLKSRKEIDGNPEAERRLRDLMARYREWQKEQAA